VPAVSRQPAVLPSGEVPGYDQAVLVTGPASVRHEPDEAASAATALAVAVPADRQPRNTIVLDLSHLPDPLPGGRDRAPLFVLSPAGGSWQPYTLLSFTGTDALFIALDGPPAQGDPRDPRSSMGGSRTCRPGTGRTPPGSTTISAGSSTRVRAWRSSRSSPSPGGRTSGSWRPARGTWSPPGPSTAGFPSTAVAAGSSSGTSPATSTRSPPRSRSAATSRSSRPLTGAGASGASGSPPTR
jgi:hypothetical protein